MTLLHVSDGQSREVVVGDDLLQYVHSARNTDLRNIVSRIL